MEEKTIIEETSKVSKGGSGILSLFLFLVILGLAFVIFGYNTKWTYKGFNFSDIFVPAVVEKTEETNNVKNAGWALFTLYQYNFSIEIPDYKLKQKFDSQDVYSYWSITHATEYYEQSLYYDKALYEDTVEVTFFPKNLPDSVACGQGCVNEHFISIDIYRNEGKKDLTTVQKAIEANLDKAFDFGGEMDATYTGELVTKWDKQVWSFSTEFVGGSSDGYIVVTEDFVYYIDFYLSNSPAVSKDIAQKVLDSIAFPK
ncbi:MAG TPA: hypothetical protein PLR67_02770 [Candidatus Dojkabacteria bacterium]|nr:hypothetical protein [Candidatus Dojkabacteria bacterium]